MEVGSAVLTDSQSSTAELSGTLSLNEASRPIAVKSSLEISENILNTEPVKTAEPTSMLSTKNLDEHDSVSTINSENSLLSESVSEHRKDHSATLTQKLSSDSYGD